MSGSVLLYHLVVPIGYIHASCYAAESLIFAGLKTKQMLRVGWVFFFLNDHGYHVWLLQTFAYSFLPIPLYGL